MVKPGNWHLAFDRIKKKAAEPNNGQGPTYPAQDGKNDPAAKQILNSQVVPLRETAPKTEEPAADNQTQRNKH